MVVVVLTEERRRGGGGFTSRHFIHSFHPFSGTQLNSIIDLMTMSMFNQNTVLRMLGWRRIMLWLNTK